MSIQAMHRTCRLATFCLCGSAHAAAVRLRPVLQALKAMINPRTKMVALVYVSNMLGSVLRVHDVAEEAHKVCALLACD